MAGLKCLNCHSSLDHLIPPVPDSPVPNAFSQLSGTLSPSEAATVKESLSSAMDCMTSLRNLLVTLESTIVSCRKSLDGHKEFIDKHSRALSCQRLPAEVWRQIFEWSAHPDQQKKDASVVFRSATPLTSPMVLTGVSRTWRNIAIHTPSLWTEMDFEIRQSLPLSKLSLLQMWLTRSAAGPFVFYVVVQEFCSSTSECYQRIRQVVQMFANHTNRWEDIYLKLPSLMYSTAPFPLSSLDILRYAVIETTDTVSGESLNFRIITECPNLESLHLENFRVSFTLTELNVPVHSIRRLDFGWRSDDHYVNLCFEQDVYDLLVSAEQLDYLTVSIKPERSRTFGLVRHNALKTLEIYTPASSIFSIFENLDLPGLESLKVHQIQAADSEVMRSFFSRSGSLQDLSLIGWADVAFLANVSPYCQATRINLERGACSEDVYPALEFAKKLSAQSHSSFFPDLREFHILLRFYPEDDDDCADNDPALITAVQGALVSLCHGRLKCNGGSSGEEVSLSKIQLTVKGPISQFTANAVAQLREMDFDGLEISVVP